MKLFTKKIAVKRDEMRPMRGCELYRWWCLLICSIFISVVPAQAQDTVLSEKHPIQTHLEKQKISTIQIPDASQMHEFYQSKAYNAIWLKGKRYNQKAKKVISVLAQAWTHGMNPEHYAVEELSQFQNLK